MSISWHTTKQKQHYKLSPSGMSRILACPGSLRLSEGREDKESEYAAEGTQAHDVAEQCLNAPVLADAASVCQDSEMAAAVQVYLDEIACVRSHHTVLVEFTERKWTHETIPDFGGTADHVLVYVDQQERIVLHAFDYKHGAGVLVDARENAQGLSYLSIIRSCFPSGSFDTFRITIVQPRCQYGDVISNWETTDSRLDEHEAAVQSAVKRTDELKAGSHCKWCKALQICPKVRSHAEEAAELSAEKLKEDKAKLRELHEATPAIEALLKQVPIAMMQHFEFGDGIEGYKVVESRGHRKYTMDEGELVKFLRKKKIAKKVYTEEKIKTPAKLEKEVGRELISEISFRPVVGRKIVAADHPGQAVSFGPDFDEVKNVEE